MYRTHHLDGDCRNYKKKKKKKNTVEIAQLLATQPRQPTLLQQFIKKKKKKSEKGCLDGSHTTQSIKNKKYRGIGTQSDLCLAFSVVFSFLIFFCRSISLAPRSLVVGVLIILLFVPLFIPSFSFFIFIVTFTRNPGFIPQPWGHISDKKRTEQKGDRELHNVVTSLNPSLLSYSTKRV